ncbi:MAG: cysteine--tRNA ligase [Proteobacteria bacterium]|nr:cysteine--tRNA ligase [Pseudomonadota bacterium]
MRFYNSKSKRVEDLTPLVPGEISMYVCGPTVYDRAHLGNARPVVVFDVLYRLLQTRYRVRYVRNITDIDDKIMKAAREKGVPIDVITQETTRIFHEEMATLRALPPTHEPRATAHVDDMIAFIEKLIAKGHAYEGSGHVLYDVASLPSYGSLSHVCQEDMLAGARVEVAPYKKNPSDFVLWKPSSDDQPGWESPWGRGRPGWHIECSAMSFALLGESFDIHGGGQDLLFPHHENECAQSIGLFGEGAFAQRWMHNGILTVNGEKMSKSLGNFLTVEELLTQAEGECLRLAILSTHYRQSLDWTEATLAQAKAVTQKFYTAIRDFEGELEDAAPDAEVLEALYDDLNTPLALARLHALTHAINTASDRGEKRTHQRTLIVSARLMGFLEQSAADWFQKGDADTDPSDIARLIEARADAKRAKDFAKADAIRADLLQKGIILEDTPQGTTWRRV